MSDDEDPQNLQGSRAGWTLDQELEVAAEVYGPPPIEIHAPPSELSDEELLKRFQSLLGFQVNWE